MAIQPIDLQAIFSQIDKVGKNQAVLREGQQIQEALQQAQNQRKIQENIQSVNETQNMGDEAEKIKDDKRRGAYTKQGPNQEKKDKPEESPQDEEDESELIRDLSLGRNIDITG